MTTLLRSLYAPARASGSRLRAAPVVCRSASSSSSSSPTAPTSTASLLERDVLSPDARNPPSRSTLGTGTRDTIFAATDVNSLKPKTNDDPDGFWHKTPAGHSQINIPPGDQYSGRSINLSKAGRTFEHAYRLLSGILSRTGVRKDVRDSEYYEKPHVMRNRQKSERHRRRFQEMIRNKVQMVQTIRNRR